MTLPLETAAVQDEYARRALERIAQQFPLQDLNLASPNNGVWTPLFSAEPMRTINATGSIVVIAAQGDGVASGSSAATNIIDVLHIAGADLAVTGKTTQLRVHAVVSCNATAPACTFTYSLCPLTVAGGAGVITVTAGAAVGSVAIASPSASASTGAVGTAFTVPADGAYVLTTLPSVAQAANSFTVHNICVEFRHA
jgi:hypothetical protein